MYMLLLSLARDEEKAHKLIDAYKMCHGIPIHLMHFIVFALCVYFISLVFLFYSAFKI